MLSARGGGCPRPGAPQGFPALLRGARVKPRSQTQSLAPCALPAPAPNSPSPATRCSTGTGVASGTSPSSRGAELVPPPRAHTLLGTWGQQQEPLSITHPLLKSLLDPRTVPPRGAEATPRTPRGGAEDTGTLPSGPEVTLRTLRLGLGRGRAQTSFPSRCEGGRRKAISYLCRIFRKPTCEGRGGVTPGGMKARGSQPPQSHPTPPHVGQGPTSTRRSPPGATGVARGLEQPRGGRFPKHSGKCNKHGYFKPRKASSRNNHCWERRC